jgi:hypothetical protein
VKNFNFARTNFDCLYHACAVSLNAISTIKNTMAWIFLVCRLYLILIVPSPHLKRIKEQQSCRHYFDLNGDAKRVILILIVPSPPPQLIKKEYRSLPYYFGKKKEYGISWGNIDLFRSVPSSRRAGLLTNLPCLFYRFLEGRKVEHSIAPLYTKRSEELKTDGRNKRMEK